MDKKNTVIGIALFAAAFGLMWFNTHEQSKHEADRRTALPVAPVKPAATTATAPAAAGAAATSVATAAPETPAAPEQLLTLDNGVVRAAITTHGGAIKTVALPGHAAKLGGDKNTAPVLFNAEGPVPALALSFPDAVTGKPVAWLPAFVVKEKTDTHIVLEARRADGLVVTREYAIEPKSDKSERDPHLIRATTAFRREGGAAAPVVAGFNIGTLPPSEGDTRHQFLNVSAFDGDNYEKISPDKFTDSSGILGFGAHKALPDVSYTKGAEPIRWVASANQFFAGIATFDAKSREFATGLYAHPVNLGKDADGHDILTITAEAGLNLGVIAPGETKTLALDYFVGPKEYSRLAALGENQDRVVQFSKVFGFISINWLCKLLMASLTGLHWIIDSVASNSWAWGLAIVTLTCVLKALTWPLTGMQMKAAENMKKLQKPIEELKVKYKDNPQKLQQETMKLYGQHRVNPFAGCLPILIQIPVFFGLFTAFQTCAELRHQPFLWFPDLSVADTIPGLPHYIHILPILMGVAMLINMRLTPMTGTDPNQKMIFYGMMALFPVMCYTMPAGLTTYYTVNNTLTVLQSWLLKRKRAAKEAAEAPGAIEVIPPAKAKTGKSKK